MARKTKRQQELIAETKAALERLTFPTSPLSRDSIKLLLNVIEQHDKNPGTTLAQAFGTSTTRGPGYSHDSNLKRYRPVHEARTNNESWKSIADRLGGKGNLPKDERTIREGYDRVWIELAVQEDMSAAFDADND